MDEPTGCYASEKFPCAIRALGVSLSIVQKNYAFKLKKDSNLIFYGKNQARLLDGAVWVVQGEALKLQTTHIQVSGRGDYWVEKFNSERTLVRNLNADIQILAGGKNHEVLPVGFENWFGGLQSDQNLAKGIVRPIEKGYFLSLWNQTAQLSKKNTIQKIGFYRQLWDKNIEGSSQLYREIVQRKLASVELKEKQRVKQEQKNKEERESLRQVFRSRLFER